MIRRYRPEDYARICELRDLNGFDWNIPDFSATDVLDVLVYVDERDIPVALACSKMIAEVSYVGDPAWQTPGQREVVLTELYEQVERELAARGIREVIAWLQMSIAKSFSRRLIRKWHWAMSKTATYCGQVRL